jgi:hypothetical protein
LTLCHRKVVVLSLSRQRVIDPSHSPGDLPLVEWRGPGLSRQAPSAPIVCVRALWHPELAPGFNERMGTIRILCLHGYHGSAAVLRRQTAPVAASLPADVEPVFVDAPSLASGDFGWWHEGFRGWERTRDWAIDLMNAQHFDGIFGFSQGAALAGLLAALRDADSAPISFNLAIMVSGFTSPLPQHAHLFTRKLRIPSLHVMGRADGIIPMRDSLLLAERFADPVIIEHAGGHVIPDDPANTTRIADFIATHSRVANGKTADG